MLRAAWYSMYGGGDVGRHRQRPVGRSHAVIVFLNGPFGIGKSTTARLLVRRLPNARLYDPEPVGAALRTVIRPFKPVPDYQDLLLWRLLVPQAARLLLLTGRDPLVMPMTVWRRDYHARITCALRRIDADLRCIQLTASEETLRRRILSRSNSKGGHAWCLAHLPSGLAMAHDPAFGLPIPTDGAPPSAVVDAILALLKRV
jgi:hypothetical protein